jgi:hypothetical protein
MEEKGGLPYSVSYEFISKTLLRKMKGKDGGDNVNNVQYKSNQNRHYKSPLYNEYILIKI